MAIDFTDRVVIVTGAGTGLGRSYALGFAERGARVVVNDLQGAETVAGEIADAGGTAVADPSSVTDRVAVAALVAGTLDRFGRIDVVINNAGILRDRSFSKMTDADWDDVLAVHLTGSANLSRAVWPVMREAGYGRIVMTTSSSGLFGNFGQANYGAAKLGLVGLMNTLAIEGAKAGIHVNAISPIAWTRMTAGLFPPAGEALMPPERIAPGVLFLASDDAPTGKVLVAGGGVFALAAIVETEPVALPPTATPDDIAAAFGRIGDLSTAAEPGIGPVHTTAFFQAALGAQSSN